ncbi:MAG: hypothetical protein EDX89_06550 [Acidobacteria bacterium]|nr:MAG: hypothetical protein EDX89_06550 [Acidobacteriota bacterium]
MALSGVLPVLVAVAATGCATSDVAPAEPSKGAVSVVEVLGTRNETDRFVRALRERSEYRGVPITIDEVPGGAPGLGKGEAGRAPRQAPEMKAGWRPSTLLRVEVKPVASVERLERQRPAGEAAARSAASEPSAEYWWEATSEVRVELIDPDGRQPRGFIDVRGEGRSERSIVRDSSRAEEAAAKALEAAAAQLLDRLKDQRSPDGTGPRQ